MPKNLTLLSKSRSGLKRRSTRERADRLALQDDRHADEAELLAGRVAAPGGAVQERRLAAHARHDDRLAALDHLAGNAFAHPVAHRPGAILEPFGRLDVQLPVAQQRDHPADDAVMAHQDAEHPLHRRLQVERARERLADLEQGRQTPRVARGGAGVGGSLQGRHIRLLHFRGLEASIPQRCTRAPRRTCATRARGRLAGCRPARAVRTMKRFCSNTKFIRQNCVKFRSPRIPHFTGLRWKCERDPHAPRAERWRAACHAPPHRDRSDLARVVSLLVLITLVTSAPIRADPVPRQPRLRLTDPPPEDSRGSTDDSSRRRSARCSIDSEATDVVVYVAVRTPAGAPRRAAHLSGRRGGHPLRAGADRLGPAAAAARSRSSATSCSTRSKSRAARMIVSARPWRRPTSDSDSRGIDGESNASDFDSGGRRSTPGRRRSGASSVESATIGE